MGVVRAKGRRVFQIRGRINDVREINLGGGHGTSGRGNGAERGFVRRRVGCGRRRKGTGWLSDCSELAVLFPCWQRLWRHATGVFVFCFCFFLFCFVFAKGGDNEFEQVHTE